MRNQYKTLIILIILLASSAPTIAAAISLGANSITNSIENILFSSNRRAHIGIKIRDVNTGRIIYEKNANTLLVPASNAKLLPAVAALSFLGPAYQFTTDVSTDTQQITGGHLKGNLYYKLSGDPSLRYADINLLAQNLANQGIRVVEGNVYIDDSVFQGQRIGDGWDTRDLRYCYSAPVSGANLDRNCFNFSVLPAKRAGLPAIIKPSNPSTYLPFRAEVQTRSSGRCGVHLIPSASGYSLTGCVRTNSRGIHLETPIDNPTEYTKQMVAASLRQQGISVNGQTSLRNPHQKTWVLVRHYSEPLSELIKTMLKKSDNLYAESMIKKVGGVYFKTGGSWKNGTLAVEKILHDKAGIDFSNANIVDGSGLSRYNLITPDQLSQVLAYAYHDATVREALLYALPIGGRDGTLKHRFSESIVRGHVRAKTGTMKGVCSLSGYLERPNSQVISFVIIVNGFSEHVSRYRALEDKICRFLVLT